MQPPQVWQRDVHAQDVQHPRQASRLAEDADPRGAPQARRLRAIRGRSAELLLPKQDKARLREESFNCFPYIQTALTLEMFKKFKVTHASVGQWVSGTTSSSVHSVND